MFDKAKPTKQDLRNLTKGLEIAATLSGQAVGLDQAIEAGIKALGFVDDAARRELSRTQLSLGIGNAYLLRLISGGNAYLKAQQAKPVAKPKAAAKGKTAGKTTGKPVGKSTGKPTGKTVAKKAAAGKKPATKKRG